MDRFCSVICSKDYSLILALTCKLIVGHVMLELVLLLIVFTPLFEWKQQYSNQLEASLTVS